jgi:hypothetical protein
MEQHAFQFPLLTCRVQFDWVVGMGIVAEVVIQVCESCAYLRKIVVLCEVSKVIVEVLDTISMGLDLALLNLLNRSLGFHLYVPHLGGSVSRRSTHGGDGRRARRP